MAGSRAEDPPEQAGRGRLRVYLGYAPGVGKTYRMLQEAHALRQQGTEAVLGLVGPRLPPETQALAQGLEQVPPRAVAYRGVTAAELDLEALLARRPALALVDEAAHTNAPGSRNRRRYQDVLDLLAAGVDVWCALDVLHLESLNDLVQRTAGVPVRETVPDTFLERADQVVAVDLPVEDLLARVASGRAPAPGRQGLLRPETLSTLRELALREVAESLARRAQGGRADAPRQASQRVMVCMASSPPRAAELLRRGSRMAGRYNTDWFVVYVQTPEEAPDRIGAEAQRQLLANTQMARELGAEVVRLEGRDPVVALVDFARAHGVAHLVIGRSGDGPWRRLLGRSVMDRMVREARGLDLHILSLEASREGP